MSITELTNFFTTMLVRVSGSSVFLLFLAISLVILIFKVIYSLGGVR